MGNLASCSRPDGRRGVAVVLVNVDLGPARLPGWFSLHPDLAKAKHFVLGPQLWNPQQTRCYCVSIFRCRVLRPQRTGVLWYFAASLGPCCQGADLIFHSPSVIDCRAISGLLQNHL